LKTSHKTFVWLAAMFLLLAAGVASTFWSYSQIEKSSNHRRDSRVVIAAADDMLSAILDAETSQRGYALTGNEAYLQPYFAVHDNLNLHLTALRQMTTSEPARRHVDVIAPLLIAKMAVMEKIIALRRSQDMNALLALVNSDEGKRLMDSIRAEIGHVVQIESDIQRQHDNQFDASMHRLFAIIVGLGVVAVLIAVYFAYSVNQAAQQRLKNLVLLETQHLLDAQTRSNQNLQQTNRALEDSEQKLNVTLNSIGDGVIATDAAACITLLNPVAEDLTGWTHAQALGRPVDEVFHIINKETREAATIPVADALAHGVVQGLANHTVLIARDGREFDIADSCAPIRDAGNLVVGAVLVFRNVSDEYAAQQTLRDSTALVQTILSTVVDGIVTIHAQGGVVESVNPAIEHMFGYTAAELLGKGFGFLIPELDQDQHNVELSHYDASDAARVLGQGREVTGFRKDGSYFPLEIAVSEMTLRGQRYFTGILRDISTRKLAEEALRKAGALQSAIFNSANFSSIATDAQGVIQIFNVGAERMLGYTAAEVMNIRTPADISDPQEVIERAKALSVELATEITPGFEALVFKAARGIEDIYELTYIRKDGSRFPAVVSVTALRDEANAIIGYLLIGTDNTARKQAEEALLKAGALQSAIFNSANFSSIATDAKGVIQIFNVGAERMLGYTALEVMNKITPAEISDPQEVIERAKALSVELATEITPGFEALVFKAARGIEDIYELTYIRKDGSRFPAVVSVTALRDEGNTIIGYLLIGTDNTARKLVEAERARLDSALQIKNIELEAARAVADKANQAKSEFLSSMSHELRSPLNAILGFAQLMESGQPTPTPAQAGSIDQILKAGWYLLELINEVLDLALIESGRLSMSLEPVSLLEVLLDCQTMIEPLATKRGIELNFPVFSDPCFVEADRTRVKQVFVNLLSNAIKYNRVNGTVDVTFKAIDHERLHISVRDTGEGLSAAKLTQLFQPFNRLGQEDSDEEGTGIGLVVSKRLVELMGGSIGAHSAPGVGSEFWIELNMAIAHVHDLTPVTPLLSPTTQPLDGAQVRTLLYVEDNLANMELVAQLIARRADMRLLRATDGVRGIAMARAHLPDVILMDINLPGINGVQALGLLREDPLTRHIPVLALSANAMPRDIERGLDAGFYRYLTKPIKIGEFMEALDQGLELAQAVMDQ
jgi:PAS domain S-box-containing protein